ncbi:YaaL family protein [Paenibacillus thailandensis]|uniref:YaaL family protein n=1 Tax=Paenibacillus thailandensis TaxID=393250 RepID=A0ABW5R1L8_9BACL
MSMPEQGLEKKPASLSINSPIGSLEWMEKLRAEIEEAKRDWLNAKQFFEYAVGDDQVDYAVYAIISAEKRYEMLLRMAKQSKQWPEWWGV